MKISRLASLFVLLLGSTQLLAQEVTGKWNSSVTTPQGPMEMVFDLVANGHDLSGTMSNAVMGSVPLSQGMAMGKDVSFKLVMQGGPGGPMTINYKGTVEGDTLNMVSTFEGAPPGGGPASTEMVATRAK